jgi:predicted nucleic acid-binding protein
MIVVSNTTPIISLASINRIEILKRLFGEITIPQAAYDEIKAKESYGYKDIDLDFIQVKKVKGELYKDLLLNQLDLGEAETIILAKELDADHVIIDENLAYKIAQNAGLDVIRTLSILLKAKNMGIIENVKPMLDEMISKGRWYSQKVYDSFLKKIGEL